MNKPVFLLHKTVVLTKQMEAKQTSISLHSAVSAALQTLQFRGF